MMNDENKKDNEKSDIEKEMSESFQQNSMSESF